MAFSPQYFLSNLNAKDGLAKPCRFEVILDIPPYINNFISQSALSQILNFPNSIITDVTSFLTGNTGPQNKSANSSMSRYLALQCESAELPGKTLTTADAKIYGPIYKVPYQTQYTETLLTFLCTNEFYERKLFDTWLNAIMPTDTNNLRFPKGSDTRYLTNVKIIQYDEFIQQIYAVNLIDAFPIGIAAQPLSWGDSNFHRVSVQFSYRKYEVIYDAQYDLMSAVTELFGEQAAAWYTQNVVGKIGQPVGTIFDALQKLAIH